MTIESLLKETLKVVKNGIDYFDGKTIELVNTTKVFNITPPPCVCEDLKYRILKNESMSGYFSNIQSKGGAFNRHQKYKRASA